MRGMGNGGLETGPDLENARPNNTNCSVGYSTIEGPDARSRGQNVRGNVTPNTPELNSPHQDSGILVGTAAVH